MVIFQNERENAPGSQCPRFCRFVIDNGIAYES